MRSRRPSCEGSRGAFPPAPSIGLPCCSPVRRRLPRRGFEEPFVFPAVRQQILSWQGVEALLTRPSAVGRSRAGRCSTSGHKLATDAAHCRPRSIRSCSCTRAHPPVKHPSFPGVGTTALPQVYEEMGDGLRYQRQRFGHRRLEDAVEQDRSDRSRARAWQSRPVPGPSTTETLIGSRLSTSFSRSYARIAARSVRDAQRRRGAQCRSFGRIVTESLLAVEAQLCIGGTVRFGVIPCSRTLLRRRSIHRERVRLGPCGGLAADALTRTFPPIRVTSWRVLAQAYTSI